MTIFEARFPGRCANECGVPIAPGDLIYFSDGEYVHIHCAEKPETKPRPICGDCFMEIAPNGVCSC